jgi:hypothetical protein
MQRYL